MNEQTKLTDEIRTNLMGFVYSDNELDDAMHLNIIFNCLVGIDEKTKEYDECIDRRRNHVVELLKENIELKDEIKKLKDMLEAVEGS